MRVLLAFACLLLTVSGQIERKFKFSPSKGKLEIETRRKEKGDASDFHQKYTWKLEATGGGFKVDAKYYTKDDGTKDKLSFSSYVKRIVEFKLNDPNATDEVFTTQETVSEKKIDKWTDAVYENCNVDQTIAEDSAEDDSAVAPPCTATFTTENGCFQVVVRANLANFQGDGRMETKPDDVKLDYIFPDAEGCEPEEGNALAVIGKFDASSKTKRKKKADPEVETGSEEIVQTDATADGASAYFNWLDVVDCGSGIKRKVKSSLDADSDDADVSDATKEVSWTVYKAKGDGVCTWDPVQGIESPDLSGAQTSAASSLTVGVLALLATVFTRL